MIQPVPNLGKNTALFMGFTVLFVVMAALVYPLSLSFVPHLVGLIGCSILYKKNLITVRFSRKITMIFLAIIVVSLSSSLWSVTPEKSLIRGIKIGAEILLCIPFLIFLRDMPEQSSQIIKKYFLYPFFICGAFFLSELIFNFPVLQMIKGRSVEVWELNKNIVPFIILSPLALFIAMKEKKTKTSLSFTGLCIMILALTDSQAAQLSGLIIICSMIGYRIVPSWMLRLCMIAAISTMVAMPWVSSPAYEMVAGKVGDEGILREACASQRLEIWDFVARKTMERPLTGFGMDTTRSISFDGRRVYYKDGNTMHPHNFALQIWVELGAIGVILGCGMIGSLFLSLRTLPPNQQILPVTLFAASYIVLLVSWSIWSSWLVGFFLALLGLCQMINKEENTIAR